MKVFNVYHHPVLNKYAAVKVGFSWTGFLFSTLWMLWNRMWMTALFYLITVLTIGFIEETILYGSDLLIISNVITIAILIFVGVKGNKWKESNISQRGYKIIGCDIVAKNKEDAISKVGK